MLSSPFSAALEASECDGPCICYPIRASMRWHAGPIDLPSSRVARRCALARSPGPCDNKRSRCNMQTNEVMHDTNDVNEVLAALRRAGQHPDGALLDRVKALGPAVVRPLIAMATDEGLHWAGQESPEVWAPPHAIPIL